MRKGIISKESPVSVRLIMSLWVPFMLSACYSQKPWHMEEVTGHLPDLNFSLTSDRGHNVTAQTYEGSILLMYFGFTNCRAECPVSMARLERVTRLLGADANRVRILFVTLDPARDTVKTLHRYVTQFDSNAVGLTGTADEIEGLAKRYRTAYRPRSIGTDSIGTDAAIMHGDAVYIFDRHGRARLLATSGDSDEDLTEDLRRLLQTSPD
jgi:protein SCO1/2